MAGEEAKGLLDGVTSWFTSSTETDPKAKKKAKKAEVKELQK